MRIRWSLIIDESLEPFFGNIDKLKVYLSENNLPDFISGYKVQRGSIGSFHYITIALHSKL
jgi:hypothetical protein